MSKYEEKINVAITGCPLKLSIKEFINDIARLVFILNTHFHLNAQCLQYNKKIHKLMFVKPIYGNYI